MTNNFRHWWHNFLQHPLRKLIKYCGWLCLLVGLIWGGWKLHQGVNALKKDITDGYLISDTVSKQTFYPKQPTVIKDNQGKVMKKLTHSQANYISFTKIKPIVRQGMVASEDRRFYQHHGVDLYGVLRAMVQLVLRRQIQGGSTLTQQLVKNVILKDQSQNFHRKIKEMVVAQSLEKKFTKQQILEFYLNDVYLGHGCYGIGSAARYYFSKPQSRLNYSEAALLIGIPNNQILYDPVTHPQTARNRRNTILYTWKQQKLISAAQFAKYSQQPLNLKIHNFQYDNDISHDYALNYAVSNAVKQLMAVHGFEMQYLFADDQAKTNYKNQYTQAYEKYYGELLKGGFIIQTTINRDLQQKVVAAVQAQYTKYQTRDADGKLEPQVASTIIDNRSGDVLALVGGRTTDGDQLNRAIDAFRQPGSTAKPIIAYAPAFERGYFPQSKVIDGPIANVHNWYSGYRGAVTLRTALADSINTVAFKLAANDKDYSFYNDLGKMEFSGLYPADKNPITAVGGFTKGVTTTEMAAAYSSFARSGRFVSPSNLRSIYDTVNNRWLYQNTHLKTEVYSKNASYMMINAMQSVVNSGSGKGARLDNYPYVAGKTGTTDNNNDSYFVGMTPSFTIANWTGYDHQTSLTAEELQLPIKTFKAEGQLLVDYLKEAKTDFPMPNTIRREGDYLFVRNNANQKTVAQIIEQNYVAFNSAQINANQMRLNNLDYRLIYHLSKKQERQREKQVELALQRYTSLPFTQLSQYDDKVAELQKIRYKNENVKRMAAKNEFNKTIMQLQSKLNLTQAKLQAQKENRRLAKFEQQKQQIQAQRDAKRRSLVDRLMRQYSTQLQRVQTAYDNNAADKELQLQKLENLINQIRSYGGTVDDPVITVHHNKNNGN